MDISLRQQQILIAILVGTTTIGDLRALPAFREVTERTLQRDLGELVKKGMVIREGEARAVSYTVPLPGRLTTTLPGEVLETLFAREDRKSVAYEFERLDVLTQTPLFSPAEQEVLAKCDALFRERLKTVNPDIVRRERERITIELSWKSSQIEGNTYTLLETESLIKEGTPASGKSKEETTMVLNHKRALEFSEAHTELFAGALSADLIIDLHRILAQDLMSDGLRRHPVGITGSAYRPLAVDFQIQEELTRFCEAVNAKESPFEKALLAFVYICYLQPFSDGNKRTSRILANAILYAHNSFPLSLRAVSVAEYKLAIIAFYELFVLGNAKQLFIGQAEFAVENYAI
jgi:fido (protein-threonine AMPylation protein)